jgi:hypothetical protein
MEAQIKINSLGIRVAKLGKPFYTPKNYFGSTHLKTGFCVV